MTSWDTGESPDFFPACNEDGAVQYARAITPCCRRRHIRAKSHLNRMLSGEFCKNFLHMFREARVGTERFHSTLSSSVAYGSFFVCWRHAERCAIDTALSG